MLDLTNKKISILGGKRSGMFAARLAHQRGAAVKVSDLSGREECDPDFLSWANEHAVATEFEQNSEEFLKNTDILVISPGVKFDSYIVRWAHEQGICVLGEIEFAFQFCTKPVIAVTGSNGKTTVVTLIHKVLKESGYQSCLCGNVGNSFSRNVSYPDEFDYFVVEISSFQMESLLEKPSPFREESKDNPLAIRGFRPHVAVMLNFSENHLDRHSDLDEYWESKIRIFSNQRKDDFAILNDQDYSTKGISECLNAKVSFFNPEGEDANRNISNPNFLAVCEVAQVLKIPVESCTKVFDSFEGVEHRLEKVRTIDGVEYINDSKATTAEAGRWAIGNIDKPILLLCGGRDKNIDFSVLSDDIDGKVKKMFVFGESKQKIQDALGGLVQVESCVDLNDAICKAKENAQAGDCVVLSPMCASFDMFKDYEERGRKYKEIVEQL